MKRSGKVVRLRLPTSVEEVNGLDSKTKIFFGFDPNQGQFVELFGKALTLVEPSVLGYR